jgi:hypothetical protein
MNMAQPNKVLRELAGQIAQIPAGEVKLTWSRVHGMPVLEASAITHRVSDVLDEVERPEQTHPSPKAEPAARKAHKSPLGYKSTKPDWGAIVKSRARATGDAFRDALAVVFPPKESR